MHLITFKYFYIPYKDFWFSFFQYYEFLYNFLLYRFSLKILLKIRIKYIFL